MYSLDNDFNLLPTRKEIIDLETCKINDDHAVFTRMDRDFSIPVSHGKVIVEAGIDKDNDVIENFNIQRLSVEFSRLKDATDDEILTFAKKYGLLGLGKAAKNVGFIDDRRELHLYVEGFRCEHTFVEPLKLWKWHINHVYKLHQLARALSKVNKKKDSEFEEGLLYVSDPLFPKHMVSDLNQGEYFYQCVYWYDREYTTVDIVRSDYSLKKVAMHVLVKNISSMLKEAVNVEPDGFFEDKSSKYGFRIHEGRSTNYLLAAIYYDLWQLIAKNEPIKICQYRRCKKPFRAVGRKKFCDDKCRSNENYLVNTEEVDGIG